MVELGDMHRLVRDSKNLSAEEACRLEDLLIKEPSHEIGRLQLVGYYWGKKFQDPELRRALRRHILWYVQYQPDAEVLYTPYGLVEQDLYPDDYKKCRSLWFEQLGALSKRVVVLRNAAWFFLLPEPDVSEKIYNDLCILEPQSPEWPKALGHLFQLQEQRNDSEAEKHICIQQSLAQYELAYRLAENSQEKDVLHLDLAKIAFKAGEYETALQYAERMVAEPGDGWNSGNYVHYGNIILGHLALVRGEKEQAVTFLKAAGKTKGGPGLNSAGPNMTLAKALYEVGERGAVLEYLDECSRFWSMDRGRLTEWQQQVEAGEAAFVSGNIRY